MSRKERLNISLGPDTMKRLVDECARLDLNRSQYISLLINERLSKKEIEGKA